MSKSHRRPCHTKGRDEAVKNGVARPGFEPGSAGPKPTVLPLDDLATSRPPTTKGRRRLFDKPIQSNPSQCFGQSTQERSVFTGRRQISSVAPCVCTAANLRIVSSPSRAPDETRSPLRYPRSEVGGGPNAERPTLPLGRSRPSQDLQTREVSSSGSCSASSAQVASTATSDILKTLRLLSFETATETPRARIHRKTRQLPCPRRPKGSHGAIESR